jgi:hypothetical protein
MLATELAAASTRMSPGDIAREASAKSADIREPGTFLGVD